MEPIGCWAFTPHTENITVYIILLNCFNDQVYFLEKSEQYNNHN